MDKTAHWDTLYRSTAPDRVSWYQAEPEPSLRMIRQHVPLTANIIDVGGGASTLVDGLLSAGYRRITVLDLSSAALAIDRARLAGRAAGLTWIEGDILTVALPSEEFQLWHDRAVFHFLTTAADRGRYLQQLRRALAKTGYVLIATFAPEGPPRCSGLDVVRYSPEQLLAELGPEFQIVDSVQHEHHTPGGRTQAFTYCLFHRHLTNSPPD